MLGVSINARGQTDGKTEARTHGDTAEQLRRQIRVLEARILDLQAQIKNLGGTPVDPSAKTPGNVERLLSSRRKIATDVAVGALAAMIERAQRDGDTRLRDEAAPAVKRIDPDNPILATGKASGPAGRFNIPRDLTWKLLDRDANSAMCSPEGRQARFCLPIPTD